MQITFVGIAGAAVAIVLFQAIQAHALSLFQGACIVMGYAYIVAKGGH